MTKPTLSSKILKKIKKGKIMPKPKWEFLLKNYVFWGAFLASILVGGLVASIAIFRIVNNDWNLAKKLGQHPVSFGFKTMPYFWLIILVIFIFIAYYNFKHTKKGYKFRLPITIISSILISVVLGFAFFGIGTAKQMEEKALRHFPQYRALYYDKEVDRWSQADKGVLAGEIKEINEISIEIESLNGDIWTILTDGLPKEMTKGLHEEIPIKIFGELVDENVFRAEKIGPWNGNFIGPKRVNFYPMKEMRKPLRTT